jgi:hypothetical protein
LYNHKKPIGDPNCPDVISRAKRAWIRIEEKVEFSDDEHLLNNEEDKEEKENEVGMENNVAEDIFVTASVDVMLRGGVNETAGDVTAGEVV